MTSNSPLTSQPQARNKHKQDKEQRECTDNRHMYLNREGKFHLLQGLYDTRQGGSRNKDVGQLTDGEEKWFRMQPKTATEKELEDIPDMDG